MENAYPDPEANVTENLSKKCGNFNYKLNFFQLNLLNLRYFFSKLLLKVNIKNHSGTGAKVLRRGGLAFLVLRSRHFLSWPGLRKSEVSDPTPAQDTKIRHFEL